MNFTISRQNHIQKKISKNLEKEAKIQEIKNFLDQDFKQYLKDKEEKAVDKADDRKLKVELNQILFLNMCKEKNLKDLKTKIAVLASHRRSNSTPMISFNIGEDKIKDLNSEIKTANANIEKELNEKELLEQVRLREKTIIRCLSERISKLQENESDLQKYSEKLIRTSVLADNLYETSSKSLQTCRKSVSSIKTRRKKSLTGLRKKEIKLMNQVETMKSKLTNKLFEDSEKESRIKTMSLKLSDLILHNRDSELESSSNQRIINSINFMTDKITKLIHKSQFINEPKGKISLSQMGDYLNKLIFAETQLQLRCSDLINLQSICRSKVQSLDSEINEIRLKFSDSQFIQTWSSRLHSPSFNSLLSEEAIKTSERKIELQESICLQLMQSLCNMQDHVNKIVKKVNTLSMDSQEKFNKSGQILRKRTLSTRSSFTILPVIKENTDLFSPFEFETLVLSLVSEKFRSQTQAHKFLKSLNKYYMLKNFLGASELAEYLSSKNSFDEVLTSFYELFKPAHENLRVRVFNICRFAISFIGGINVMSKQVLNSFDTVVISEVQLNKYLSMFPYLKTNDKCLKNIVERVVRMQMKVQSYESMKQITKKHNGELLRKNSVFSQRESPQRDLRMEDLAERAHKRTSSQKEIKSHIEELNVKLVKSSRRIR